MVAVAGRAKWLVIPREDDRLEIQFDEWNTEYAFALDIQRGPFQCSVPVTGPTDVARLSGLVYERRDAAGTDAEHTGDRAETRSASSTRSEAAIDWETVTPLDEIPRSSIPNRVKRGLRWWKLKRAGASS